MELRQLRTFKAVAELGSLSKASDRLRIAQPALSRQIKLLEHELRSELFVRTGRGMTLTSAGQMLFERTVGIMRQLEQVRDDIQSDNSSPSGQVVLGLVPTVSAILSARFAKCVVEELPNISLRIVESYGGHLMEWLHRGEMDLAVIYGPADDLHLTSRAIGCDDLVAIGPIGCGLREKGEIELNWLVKQKLVLPSYSHGLRMLIEKAAAKNNIDLDILVEADSYRVLMSLVEDGLGFTMLPPSALQTDRQLFQLESAKVIQPVITRELILASPTDRQPSIASAAIATRLIEEFNRLAEEGGVAIRKVS
jgi:DNA-binding transcriptional LysR family regulator